MFDCHLPTYVVTYLGTSLSVRGEIVVSGMCACWLYSREYGECPVADTWVLRAISAINIYLSQSLLCEVRKSA
jgi:hypothetical protein